MAIDNLNRAGEASSRPRAEGAAPVPNHVHSRRREIEADKDSAQAKDSVDVRSFDDVVNVYRAHQQRLERTLEGRRKYVDAVRELMNSGALDTEEAARRTADGILRRGA